MKGIYPKTPPPPSMPLKIPITCTLHIFPKSFDLWEPPSTPGISHPFWGGGGGREYGHFLEPNVFWWTQKIFPIQQHSFCHKSEVLRILSIFFKFRNNTNFGVSKPLERQRLTNGSCVLYWALPTEPSTNNCSVEGTCAPLCSGNFCMILVF